MNTFQIIGFVIWGIFYGVYFLKLILQRKKGIQTNQMGKGDKKEGTKGVEKALYRSSFALAVIQCCSIAMGNRDLLINNTSLRLTGLGIAGLGTICFIIAIITMRDSWRAGVDTSHQTTLITSGIYRYSRNPAFVGFDLLYIGLAAAFPNGILVAVSCMGIVMMHLQIREEEKALSDLFGTAYDVYKKKTPRYFLF